MNGPPSAPGPRGTVAKGVLIGVLATLAVLAILAGLMFLAMGRCPMCGQMMS